MDEFLKTHGDTIKSLLAEKRNQEILLIAGAAYFLSKTQKERNALLAGVAGMALLPKKTEEDTDGED